jgi:hypothetical protein
MKAPREPAVKATREPLRGDAAWRAQLADIKRRNEVARQAGVKQRAVRDAADAATLAQLARREARDTPTQPGR